jgi:hypothetical protein|tara:strand:+ start:54 stop:224 length:171 start_codon:yes stop_codon:yes gene_type:complete
MTAEVAIFAALQAIKLYSEFALQAKDMSEEEALAAWKRTVAEVHAAEATWDNAQAL